MYFQYGGYRHPQNEVDLAAFMVYPKLSHRNRRATTVYEMHLHGQVNINDPSLLTPAQLQAAINARVSEIVDAYADDNKDAMFLHDDLTPTRHTLISDRSLSGVKVRRRSWPRGGQEEYATCRTFYIVLSAEYLEPSAEITYLVESVRHIGTGGPRFVVTENYVGPPTVQVVNQMTTQKIIQHGMAIGLEGWPRQGVHFSPLWPQFEHLDQREITPSLPQSFSNGWIEYPITWQYTFTLPYPTNTYPTLR